MRRRWTVRRFRALVRHSGPTSLRFRQRLALLGGAVLIGLAALAFTQAADLASLVFRRMIAGRGWLPLIITPLGFMAIVWATRRFAPLAAGSGIPQIIAAIRLPSAKSEGLMAVPVAIFKSVLTLGGLLVGASVGREGPTVQISAAILSWIHRVLKVPMRSSIIIAGGAAGVAAAFNTPLAGIAFAIEELATAYEQKTTLLVITAVIVSGMVALSLAGNYVYFGIVNGHLEIGGAIVATVIAGVIGGLLGGLFSRLMLSWQLGNSRLATLGRKHAIWAAAICGAGVAMIGYATDLTWGTGYEPARRAITGLADLPWTFMPAKFVATLLTSFSGMPGGIFAPSLATGAGVGDMLRYILPDQPAGPIILLGMVAYFTGVVRAPLTAVIVISETTGSRGMMLPLLGAAIIADFVAGLVCRERLYHGLAHKFQAMLASGLAAAPAADDGHKITK
jgi:H+/Cl- antiporter ClcA